MGVWNKQDHDHSPKTSKEFMPLTTELRDFGGILALRAHCALLLDYVPPEEPLGMPLGNTLRIRRDLPGSCGMVKD